MGNISSNCNWSEDHFPEILEIFNEQHNMPVKMENDIFDSNDYDSEPIGAPEGMAWNPTYNFVDDVIGHDYTTDSFGGIMDEIEGSMFFPPGDCLSQIDRYMTADCMWSGTAACPTMPLSSSSKWLTHEDDMLNDEKVVTIQNSNSAPVHKKQFKAGDSLLISSSRTNGARIIPNDKGGTRPDTPLSLHDEIAPPVFKHQIDLCSSIGSINRKRTDSANTINMYKAFLTSTDRQSCPPADRNVDVLDLVKELSDYDLDQMDMDDDCDTDSDYSSLGSTTSGRPSTGGKTHNSMFMPPIKSEYQETSFGDHSYTRPKERFDTCGLGVETPSDSEEDEIDIGNVHERTLPTNPSARDRRTLQNTVANKISARMVKTQKNGLRTIPPRRRISDDNASSTPAKAWSGMSTPQHSSSSSVTQRKRPQVTKKNYRGKKQNAKTAAAQRRQISDTDEAETLEKRNLHNDMERQRRIGLKNLFDELKSTVPAIKDKERAPKVQILREAANLCKKLTADYEEYQGLKKQQTRLQNKYRQLTSGTAFAGIRRYE